MTERRPGQAASVAELPAVEFVSPGRFALCNPEPSYASTRSVAEGDTPSPSAETTLLTTATQLREHTLALAQQARRSLVIYSQALDPWLYGDADFVEACVRLLLSHPRNRLAVIVADPTRALRTGHQLLDLSHRLTSNLRIRRLASASDCDNCEFVIADDNALIVRTQADRPEARVSYHAPGKVRQQRALFDRAWELSVTDPNLRSFRI